MVISQYLSIRPAWLVVPSTLVSRIGCSRAVKGMFIFCMLWYTRFGLFALPQVVEVEQFKNPLVRRTLHSGLCPEHHRLAPSIPPPIG